MMKAKKTITWLLFALCLTARSQISTVNNVPFVQDGKKWEMQVGGIEENLYGNRIDGDTLIDGTNWKKVYNYIFMADFNYPYYVALREVDKKVYAIAKDSNKPRLLYNFNLKVGDIVNCGMEGNAFACLLDDGEQPDMLLGFPFKAYLRLDRIDTIQVSGSARRRFILTLLDAFREPFEKINNVVWIEGVGSGAGPFSPWMPLPPRECIHLNCEDANHNYLFVDFFGDYGISTANSNHYLKSESDLLVTLQGRRLAGKPSKGVYIQGNKKRVVK